MLGALARGLFGTANDRVVKGFDKPVAKINALEPELTKLSDEQLRARTTEFRERLAKGSERGADAAVAHGTDKIKTGNADALLAFRLARRRQRQGGIG